MPSLHGVANHLRYMRSNIAVVIICFMFAVATAFVGQSLLKSGSVLAEMYDGEGYAYGDGNRHACYGERHSCGDNYPRPDYICTWMKASISDRTVTLHAQGNIGDHARIIGYKYDFGDGYVVHASGLMSHTYSRYDTYNTKAWIQYKMYGDVYWTAPCTLIVKVLPAGHYPKPTHKPHPTHEPHPTHKSYSTYKPYPTYEPKPTYEPEPEPEPEPETTPEPSETPAPVHEGNNNNTNINNNNSSATANVYINKTGSSGAKVTKAGYAKSSAPAYIDTGKGGYPIELPKTGPEEMLFNALGAGGLVAAGTAYVSSRRELHELLHKRN